MTTIIHKLADVSESAQLGAGVVVGPFCHIGPKVKIGEGTVLGPSVTVTGHTSIGERNEFIGHAVIGGPPQDKKYEGEQASLVIGDDNIVREFVTMNIGTAAGSWITSVGNRNLFMACAHIAHDCVLEDDIIVGNNVMLAGHVRIEERAILAGGAAANHFVTIGTQAFVGGMARIMQDAPPYMTIEGHQARVRGVNSVGMRRAGHSDEAIESMRVAYRRLFRSDEPRARVIQDLEEAGMTPEVRRLLSFLRDMDRGFQGRYRESLRRPEVSTPNVAEPVEAERRSRA